LAVAQRLDFGGLIAAAGNIVECLAVDDLHFCEHGLALRYRNKNVAVGINQIFGLNREGGVHAQVIENSGGGGYFLELEIDFVSGGVHFVSSYLTL